MARILFVTVLAAASLSLTGCMGSPGGEEEDEEVAAANQAAKINNGLSINGLTSNGLTSNGLTSNGLTSNGLTSNGLTSNSLAMAHLSDAETGDTARKILAYATGCALPLGESFDLTINEEVSTFSGQLGLAPQWGGETGSCDSACQAWVSGCILSRVNHEGVTIPISARGTPAALTTTEQERSDYPTMEAVYYGDLFADPPTFFACMAHGPPLIERVCGPSISECAVDVVGYCDENFTINGCDPNVDPGCTPTARCGIPDTTEGYYPDCRDDAGNTYLGSVTVFRQCGNGVCDVTETNAMCPQDCP
jgi:hypothetical protein